MSKTLYTMGSSYRQILFLELIADAIVRLEQASDLESTLA